MFGTPLPIFMHPDVLNSWKEIADYLGRGVRTIQRWERELSLPVHRPYGQSRSPVVASRSELDVWLHMRRHRMDTLRKPETIALLHAQRSQTRQQRAQLIKNLQRTQQLVESLAAKVRRTTADS